jgi:hypothetical protein
LTWSGLSSLHQARGRECEFMLEFLVRNDGTVCLETSKRAGATNPRPDALEQVIFLLKKKS